MHLVNKMTDYTDFKNWLQENTTYSRAVIGDIASRMNRADHILKWNNSDTYLFYLNKEKAFMGLSVSVRSQIRKAVKLYTEYQHSSTLSITHD